MMLKKLLCAAAACVMAASLASCGAKEDTTLNYEKPLTAAAGSLNFADGESYLNCFLPQEKARYTEEEKPEEDFMKNIFDRKAYGCKIRTKITDTAALSDEELQALEQQAHEKYGVRFDFTKGQSADVRFQLTKDDELLADDEKLTFVRCGGVWYIYGEVIDSLELTAQTDKK